jgi:hypothetical protein
VSTFKGRFAILSLWVLPGWLVRWLPSSFHETVEREVYDGLTRQEWFEAQVRDIQAAPFTRVDSPKGGANGA